MEPASEARPPMLPRVAHVRARRSCTSVACTRTDVSPSHPAPQLSRSERAASRGRRPGAGRGGPALPDYGRPGRAGPQGRHSGQALRAGVPPHPPRSRLGSVDRGRGQDARAEGCGFGSRSRRRPLASRQATSRQRAAGDRDSGSGRLARRLCGEFRKDRLQTGIEGTTAPRGQSVGPLLSLRKAHVERRMVAEDRR